MEEPKPLPCPFDGKRSHVVEIVDRFGTSRYEVVCSERYCRLGRPSYGRHFKTKSGAIRAWNKRAKNDEAR